MSYISCRLSNEEIFMRFIGLIFCVIFTTANAMADIEDYYKVFTDESYHNLDSKEGRTLTDLANKALLELGEFDRGRLIDRINDGNDKETSLLYCDLGRVYYILGLEFENCVGIQFTNSNKVKIQGYEAVRFIATLGAGVSFNTSIATYDGELPEESGGDLTLFAELTLLNAGGTIEISSKLFQSGMGLAISAGFKIGDSGRSTSIYEVEIKDDFYEDLMKE